MRAVALAILATSLSPAAALAADFDPGPLRGTEYVEPAAAPIAVWEGVYFGGFGGISQSNFQIKGDPKAIVAPVVYNTTLETEHGVSSWLAPLTKKAHGENFGAFAGYNSQFEEVVLGFELDYTHTGIKNSGFDQVDRIVGTSDGYQNIVKLTGVAKTEISDLATLRARAGYTAGAFLPFVTGGVALGRFLVTDSVTTQIARYNAVGANDGYAVFDPLAPITFDATHSILKDPVALASHKRDIVAFGLTAGAGLDIALTQNIFLRGEYQYAWFDDLNGHKFNVNTVRGGAGVKF